MKSSIAPGKTLNPSEIARFFATDTGLGLLNSLFAYGFITGWSPVMNLAWFVALLRIALALFVLLLIVMVVYDEDLQTKELLQSLQNILKFYQDNRWFIFLCDCSFWAFAFAAAAYGSTFLAILLAVQVLISSMGEAIVKALLKKRSDLLDAEGN